MSYKSEHELYARAKQFIESLTTVGISAAIEPKSARDYLLKLSIYRDGKMAGLVSLYHKPSKNSFTLRVDELKDASITEEVQRCFGAKLLETAKATELSGYIVYVDGSYIEDKIGYGAVVLHDDRVIKEFFGRIEDVEVQSMRQVVGELTATMTALVWCRENEIKELTLCYDYLGIEYWATRKWRANNSLTQRYATFMTAYLKTAKNSFHKIESHTGDRWNDRADTLAKHGARTSRPNDPSQTIAPPDVAPIPPLSMPPDNKNLD